MNNFVKNDIINELSKKIGFSNHFSKKIINDLINCIITQVHKTDLNFKNFGVFKSFLKKSRVGRNPKTKEEFKIKARKLVKFIPSKKFTNLINHNYE